MNERTPEHQSLNRVSRIAGVLPWLATLVLVVSALYVRFMLGRWPRVYRNSPEFFLSDAAALMAMLAAVSWPAMTAVALLLPIVRMNQRARPVFNRWVFSSWAGAVVLYVLCAWDPYGFLEWALD